MFHSILGNFLVLVPVPEFSPCIVQHTTILQIANLESSCLLWGCMKMREKLSAIGKGCGILHCQPLDSQLVPCKGWYLPYEAEPCVQHTNGFCGCLELLRSYPWFLTDIWISRWTIACSVNKHFAAEQIFVKGCLTVTVSYDCFLVLLYTVSGFVANTQTSCDKNQKSICLYMKQDVTSWGVKFIFLSGRQFGLSNLKEHEATTENTTFFTCRIGKCERKKPAWLCMKELVNSSRTEINHWLHKRNVTGDQPFFTFCHKGI